MCKAFLPLVPLLGKEASKEVEEGEREREMKIMHAGRRRRREERRIGEMGVRGRT